MKPVYDRMTEILYEAESAEERKKRVDADHAARSRADMKRSEALDKIIADREKRRKAAEAAKAAKEAKADK